MSVIMIKSTCFFLKITYDFYDLSNFHIQYEICIVNVKVEVES